MTDERDKSRGSAFEPTIINRHLRSDLFAHLQDFREGAPAEDQRGSGMDQFIQNALTEVIFRRIEEIKKTRGAVHLLHLTGMPTPKFSSPSMYHLLSRPELTQKGIYIPDSSVFYKTIAFQSLSQIFHEGQIETGLMVNVAEALRKRIIYLQDVIAMGPEDEVDLNINLGDLIILDNGWIIPENDDLLDPTLDIHGVYVHFSEREKKEFNRALSKGKRRYNREK